MTDHQRELVLNEASAAAITLDTQLNNLMDIYDSFIDSSLSIVNPLLFEDLLISIEAMSILPSLIAVELIAWKSGNANIPLLEFDIDVINEFAIHLNSIVHFLKLHDAPLDGFENKKVDVALTIIRTANQLLGMVKV